MPSANARAFPNPLSQLPDFTADPSFWPMLPPLETWKATCDTLHMWTQVVGKVRLALCPRLNHWWEVALQVSSRGLTTSAMPYSRGLAEIEFDFLQHQLIIHTSEGGHKTLALAPRTVADFYQEFMSALRSLGIEVKIWATPVEIPDPIPFEKDDRHASYDGAQAALFWRALLAASTVFEEFRSRFIGKDSPVHFFWGSFDLAVTRFSGRRAPDRPGADSITREAYSHEVISAGFWPGGGDVKGAAFTPMRRPSRKAWLRLVCTQPARTTTRRCTNSFCCTKMFASHRRPEPPCSIFCRARMAPPPTLLSGIGDRWNARLSAVNIPAVSAGVAPLVF